MCVHTMAIYQTQYTESATSRCICVFVMCIMGRMRQERKKKWTEGKKACDFSFCLAVVFVSSAVVCLFCLPYVWAVKMDLCNLPLNFTETSTRYTLFRSSIHQRKGSIAIDWTRPYKGKGSRKIQRIHLHKSQYNGILSSFSPSGLI